MARLVVALVFLGIYFVIWLVKQAGKPNNLNQGGYTPPLPPPERWARGGGQPAALNLPPGSSLLLSSQTTYPSLDEAFIILGFMRMEGPPNGEPNAALWRRGAVTVRYTFDGNRRELHFEGEGAESARQQVAGKVTWMRG
jgi:hypothetical protein